MKTVVSVSLAAGLVAGLVFWVGGVHQPLPADLAGLNSCAQSVLPDADGAKERQRLQVVLNDAHERMAAKREAASEVIAGDLSLLEAAARFRDINAGAPNYRQRMALNYPDTSYEELLCRQVIAAVESVLEQQAPEQVDDVVEQLRQELRQHLERDGTVVLAP
jgi:hypothetical protein